PSEALAGLQERPAQWVAVAANRNGPFRNLLKWISEIWQPRRKCSTRQTEPPVSVHGHHLTVRHSPSAWRRWRSLLYIAKESSSGHHCGAVNCARVRESTWCCDLQLNGRRSSSSII